jgi:hypothetical protein
MDDRYAQKFYGSEREEGISQLIIDMVSDVKHQNVQMYFNTSYIICHEVYITLKVACGMNGALYCACPPIAQCGKSGAMRINKTIFLDIDHLFRLLCKKFKLFRA